MKRQCRCIQAKNQKAETDQQKFGFSQPSGQRADQAALDDHQNDSDIGEAISKILWCPSVITLCPEREQGFHLAEDKADDKEGTDQPDHSR